MRKLIAPLCLILLFSSNANAWNYKGHMVVARIAWKELSAQERAKVVKTLAIHPHYQEYLASDRPDGFAEDEWVFMRAATWSDWVRGGPAKRKAFDRPTWHYVNLPIVQEGSKVALPETPAGEVIKQIDDAKLKIRAGSRDEAAVSMCWLFHLIGDIHQPLHCVALFGDAFPTGDRGGNLSLIRIETRVVQMHSFWDGLLGAGSTPSAIDGAVVEIEKLLKDNPGAIDDALKSNVTAASWAKEAHDLAKRVSYADGKLKPANSSTKPANADIPTAPGDYARNSGETARYAIAKAGRRLAAAVKAAIAE